MGRHDVDQRTDVFALTAILYECVTGAIAFDGPNIAQILMKIINQAPTPPSQQRPGLPPRMDDVVDRGLRKDKKSRYASALLLAAGLCDAYGLEADASHWAAAKMADIARALASATPPLAGAFVESIRPPDSPLQRSTKSGPDSLSSRPPQRSSGMVIGVAVGAFAVVALIATLLLR
jgi:serine/threonine protein kinase